MNFNKLYAKGKNQNVKSHLHGILENHSALMHAGPRAERKKRPGCQGPRETWEGVYRLLCFDLSSDDAK